MADIERPRTVRGVEWEAYRSRDRERGRPFPYRRGGSQEEAHHDPRDAVRILGLDPRAYPQEVQTVLSELLERIDHLRDALEQSERRQAYLEGLADRHPFLPVVNRRAFLRELAAFLDRHARTGADGLVAEEEEPPGTLALFYLENFEELHREHGLMVAEEALAFLARCVAHGVRTTDLVGAVGGAGIAVLLPLAQADAVQRKVETMQADLSAQPFPHEEMMLSLRVAAATVGLPREATAEGALAEVDAALRRRMNARPEEP